MTYAAPVCSVLVAVLAMSPMAHAADATSSWQQGHNVRTRLLAGVADGGPAQGRVQGPVAGLQIVLANGWKTYWRNPGDAGGVPPYVTFTGSGNLKSADVLFPAPHRLTDASGDSIGYKGEVVLPIRIVPVDAARPVTLKLQIEYGVCREICIPAEARHEVVVPAATTAGLPAPLAAALAAVPVQLEAGQAEATAAVPRGVGIKAELAGKAPALTIEVAFPPGASEVDLFLEAPDGLYLPLPKRVAGPAAGPARFFVDLSGSGDVKTLSGKTVTATAVSAQASSEFSLKIP